MGAALLFGSNAVTNLPSVSPPTIERGATVRLADGRVGFVQSLHGGSQYAIVAIETDGDVKFITVAVPTLTTANDVVPVRVKRSTIVRNWVEITVAHRNRTRPPGCEMAVMAELVRGWEWPHRDCALDPEFVRVEIEGNVPVGGGEIARWLVDDRAIFVMPHFGSVLVAIGPFNGANRRYELGWHYRYVEDAMEAARNWDGEGEPPCPLGPPKRSFKREPVGEGASHWVYDSLVTGLMPAEGEEACPFCYVEVGQEHEPFCAISEAEPGLSLRNVTLDDVRSLSL